MEAGRRAAKKILASYPDYGKAPPEYVVNLAESLSYLKADDLAVVLDPLNGVAARCKFLPTFADICAVLQDHKNRQEQFQPTPTQYKRLEVERGPWDQETDFKRKRRVVQECLGYNPDARGAPAKREFTAPSPDEVRALNLKIPPAPPSRELIEHLQAEGWPFIPQAAE